MPLQIPRRHPRRQPAQYHDNSAYPERTDTECLTTDFPERIKVGNL